MRTVQHHTATPQNHAAATQPEQAARTRARHALVRLEDAQRAIREAAAKLAPVRGAEREHVRLQRLDAKLRRAWNRLARLFDQRLDMDLARMSSELGAVDARRAA